MATPVVITAAANTLAPALAALRAIGFSVSRDADGLRLYRAESLQCSLSAEDPLILLGLAKLYEIRGRSWQPTDAEIAALLSMEGGDA